MVNPRCCWPNQKMTEICLLSTRYLLLHEIENHHWLPEGFNLFVFAASKRSGKGLVIQNQFNTNYSQWCYIVASKNPCFGRCGWASKPLAASLCIFCTWDQMKLQAKFFMNIQWCSYLIFLVSLKPRCRKIMNPFVWWSAVELRCSAASLRTSIARSNMAIRLLSIFRTGTLRTRIPDFLSGSELQHPHAFESIPHACFLGGFRMVVMDFLCLRRVAL